jgi:hypothetical protein
MKTMTSFDAKLIEMLALDVIPHPLEVKRGAFRYWNDLAVLMGIDLAEEMAIIDASQEESNE